MNAEIIWKWCGVEQEKKTKPKKAKELNSKFSRILQPYDRSMSSPVHSNGSCLQLIELMLNAAPPTAKV